MPLKVVTYNVLAPSHTHLDWYPDASAEMLSGVRRAAHVCDQLISLEADIYCLQEVEPAWLEQFRNALEPRGFVAHFAQKAGGKIDGCATFVRTRLLRERHVARLFFSDSLAGEPPSGCLALAVFVEWEGATLGIVNTHLKWDAPDTPPQLLRGLRQMNQLLTERQTLTPPEAIWQAGDWLICGDFNCTADSPVGKALTQAGFSRAACDSPTMFAPASTSYAAPIDHLYASEGLLLSAATAAVLPRDLKLPNYDHPSDHLPVWALLDRAKPR